MEGYELVILSVTDYYLFGLGREEIHESGISSGFIRMEKEEDGEFGEQIHL